MLENSTTDEIEFMLKQFRPERYAYLVVTIISFILLFVCVIFFMIQNPMDEKKLGFIAGMVGSGGAIAYTAAQLLRMWKDCIDLLLKKTNSEKNHD